MENINIKAYKDDGFNNEEIEKIKKGLLSIKLGDTISYEKVKINSRKQIFSRSKNYV